jgi:hypothetical protein
VGAFHLLALLAAFCGSLGGRWELPISAVPNPSKEGLSRAMKETVVLCVILIV